MLWTELALLAIGLALLLKGSDVFVEYASRVARLLGLSPFVIGLTIVATGTSLPELATSVFASLAHNSGIAVGTVIGSNIANILLILGVSAAWFAKVQVSRRVFQRDCFLMFATTLLFYLTSLDGVVSRRQGLFFLLLFFLYTYVALQAKTSLRHLFDFHTYLETAYNYGKAFANIGHAEKTYLLRLARNVSMMALGLVGVVYGAQLLVGAAEQLARVLEVNDELIAMTLVAVGTSLPEAAVTLTALRKNLPAIAMGNIIGSNIANVLLVLGAAAFAAPLTVHYVKLGPQFGMMLISAGLLALMVNAEKNLTREDGIFLLSLFLLFLLTLLPA